MGSGDGDVKVVGEWYDWFGFVFYLCGCDFGEDYGYF